MRSAHKIMHDNGVVPDWITEADRLDQLEAGLRQQIQERATRYSRERQIAAASGDSSRALRVEKSWQRYVEDYLERVERYNRDVLLHNLKLPRGITHKRTLNGDELIGRARQSQP